MIVAAKMRKSVQTVPSVTTLLTLKDLISENETVSKRAGNGILCSVYEFDKDRQFAYIVAGIAGIIALVFFYSALQHVRAKTKRTTNYTAAYPELNLYGFCIRRCYLC